MSQFALGAVICVEHYILWKNFLDIQDGVSYTSPNKKEVLINKSPSLAFALHSVCALIAAKIISIPGFCPLSFFQFFHDCDFEPDLFGYDDQNNKKSLE